MILINEKGNEKGKRERTIKKVGGKKKKENRTKRNKDKIKRLKRTRF